MIRETVIVFGGLILWCAVAASAPADEVYLADGRVLEGEVVSAAGAAVIDVRIGSGSMVAIQHFEKGKVLRIVFGTSSRQNALAELRGRQAKLGQGGDAEAWWQLATEAKNLGDTVLFKEFAGETVSRDRAHIDAHKALGLSLYNGVWMRANEVAVARGEVFFHGQWLGWGEREAILIDEARRHDELEAARKVRAEQRRAALVQAAAEAAASTPYPETSLNGYPSSTTRLLTPYGSTSSYRAIYWPSYGTSCGNYSGFNGGFTGYPCPQPGPTVGIQASGGGGNHQWSFSWNF